MDLFINILASDQSVFVNKEKSRRYLFEWEISNIENEEKNDFDKLGSKETHW
jgi:hypothetical protein